MTDLQQRLTAVLETLADETEHDPQLAETVCARAGCRWPSPRAVIAVGAAAAVAVVAALAVVLLRPDRPEAIGFAVDGGDAGDVGYECPARIPTGTLPEWARAGFTDPRAPYVLGDEGLVVAVVFADPLVSPSLLRGSNNKVLWVPREGAGEPLRIEARRSPGDEPVVVRVDAGPSVVDLPRPGCWHLELTWGGQRDSLNLRYRATRGTY